MRRSGLTASAGRGCQAAKKGGGEEQECEDAGGVEDGVVEGVCGVMKEGIVVGAEAGEDGHGDLNPRALEEGGDEIESGECKGEHAGERGGNQEAGSALTKGLRA